MPPHGRFYHRGRLKNPDEKLPFRRQLQNQLFLFRIVMKACPGRFFADVAFNFFNAATEFLAYSLLLRYAINGLTDGRPFGSIALLVALFFGAHILVVLVQSFYDEMILPRLNENSVRYVQTMMFRKAMEVDLSCYENPEFYDRYVKALGESAARTTEFIDVISNAVYVLVSLISNAALLFTIDPALAAFVVIPFGLSFLKIKRDKLEYRKAMAEAEQGRRRTYVRRIFYLNEFAKEVRLTKIERPMMNYYNESSENVVSAIKKYGIKIFGLAFLMDAGGELISHLGSIAYSVVMTTRGIMQYGDAVVAIGSVTNVSQMLSSAVNSVTDLSRISLYTENLRKFLEYDTKIREDENGLSPTAGDIVFENVSFAYEGCGSAALKNVSLTIKKGERVALVGHNGAGKSTLIKLLMRLYEPTEGRILLDGKDIKEYKLSEYRSGFGTVFQDMRHFSLSVAENVLGRRVETEEDREAVIEALKKSGSYPRVMRMKNGIDTVLTREFDDDGEVLSGGESQKLAIARVFSKHHFCIILDEPTSALDPLAEADMYKHMYETAAGRAGADRGSRDADTANEKTSNSPNDGSSTAADSSLLFISHRLSSAVDADKIYLIEDGSIIESGTHKELMAKGGAYASMFLRQAQNYRMSGDKRKGANANGRTA